MFVPGVMTCRLWALSQDDVPPRDAGELQTCVLLPCLQGWVLNHSPAAFQAPLVTGSLQLSPVWSGFAHREEFCQESWFSWGYCFYQAVSAAITEPWHCFCTPLACSKIWLKCHIWHSLRVHES